MDNSLTVSIGQSVEYIRARHGDMYCREDVENAIRALHSEENLNSARCYSFFRVIERALTRNRAINNPDSIVSEIRTLLFNRAPVRDIISRIPPEIKTREEFLYNFVNDISLLYEEMYTPEDYMRRLVNRLIDPDIAPGADGSVRLAILRQFLRLGGYGVTAFNSFFIKKVAADEYEKRFQGGRVTRQQKINFVWDMLDDGVFDKTEETDNVPEILSLADCLGSGRFRTLGGTKKFLYMFAIAFDMTYYTGGEGETIDVERDIVRNLFEDYYNNNLLRDMVEIHHSRGVETMPSGAGINFKNAVEVAYLYVIKRSDLSANEKFDLFKDITDAFSAFRGEPEAIVGVSDARLSEFCKEKTLSMFEEMGLTGTGENAPSAKDIAKKISAFCNTSEKNINTSSDQKRAFNNYRRLIEQIEELCPDTELSSILQPAQESEQENYWIKYFVSPWDSPVEDEIDDALQRFIGIVTDEELFDLTDPNKISRFQLIAVYFYYFCEQHKGTGESLPYIYDHFVDGLNAVLLDSNYQLFSEKNFFDMLMVANAFVQCSTAEADDQ